ncbi:PQQ-dependent sugar dehydrogenase [Candidatus Pelagibacter sp.]|uniref:PQQ-dependent sugar dehydrogenase n=1 Tax=Candidatus Pelagibacter sp. TaxID=2024849 RepID=UPI003F866814
MIKKIVYFFSLVIFVSVIFFSFKIISGKYDKQNELILKIKEAIPKKLENHLRNLVYDLRRFLIEDELQKIQAAKISQGLNGELISTKKIFTELSKTEFNMKEFFLPFERLDLSYGWKSIINAKRAHYLDTAGDKTIVVSGKGDFIFFETKNFFSKKLDQKIISSNLDDFIKNENFEFVGLRDLLIDEDNLYLSVILQDKDKKYTLAIINAKLDYKKLKFQFFFKTELLLTDYSIGSGGRIVNYGKDKFLFTIGHLDLKDKIQSKENLAGKIISINKSDQSYEILSLGHRNQQGLFYFKNIKNNEFVINSEHGPKGGDEININNLNKQKLYNFGWPISSYGTNYDGTNPFKLNHKDYGYEEPLIYFTPSIGISEISVRNIKDSNFIFASSLRAHSIYIVETNEEFSKVINKDRLNLGNRIRDIKFVPSLKGFIVILENIPSIGFIQSNS